ncbi:related to integral membrane protein PTH11 [Phialocephala subalpina]|uniref:Related to integral membrane protein PTH11 n=1 Tax=Phialocephala subalpina TaxID=576137 RepID=A0A1L7WHV3_9HELO|nr:related to integral membrane protein PTH11 [Phialocephala subalpina]
MSESTVPDVNKGGSALGVIWTLDAIAILIVGARCYTQKFVTRQFGLSEILVVISVCVITGMASMISVQYHYGWGRHYVDIPTAEATKALEFNAIGQSFGVMGSTFGRLSFIILMLKLFGITKPRRWSLWALFWAQLISNGVVVVTLYVQCSDVRALWDFSIKTYCWPEDVQTYIGYAHSGWNGATDLFLTFLPTTMLWTLKMNLKTKIGLSFLLSLSFLAFVGVIMKIVYLRVLAHRADYTYNTVPLFTWVIVESTLVAIASSIPLLRPLFIKAFPSLGTQTLKNSSYVLKIYGNSKQPPSYVSTQRFSKLGEGHNSRKDIDTGSEDGILAVREPQDAILKEVSYSVRVTDLEHGEKREQWDDGSKHGRSTSMIGHAGRIGGWEHD